MADKSLKPIKSKNNLFKRLKTIGCGCLIILIILIVLGVIFSGVIIRKVITGAIQQKTGAIVNVDNLNNGQMTYTDPKTGAKLNIGENKIPDDFPKDFPIYPGATVTTSLSGNQGNNKNGFWLTLTTNDDTAKVVAYYQDNLKINGWTAEATNGAGVGTNWVVSKGALSGYVTIETSNGKTSILIVLGETTQSTTAQ